MSSEPSSARVPTQRRESDPLVRLGNALALLATVWIVLLMLLIVSDILARNIWNSPLRGVPELARESVVAIVFLSLPFSLQNDRWIKSEMLIGPLEKRFPRLGMSLRALFHALSCAIMVFITIESVRLLIISWEIGDYVGARGIFTFPVWPVKTIIVFGSFFVTLIFARKTYETIKYVREMR